MKIECSWSLKNGVLTIFPSDIKVSGHFPPWRDRRSEISKIVIEPGVVAGESVCGLFEDLGYLTEIEGLGNFNTAGTKDFSCMFLDCISLKKGDFERLNTSSAEHTVRMFEGCSSLQTLDLSSWDTRSVKNMNWMFKCCFMLEELNIEGWDTSNVEEAVELFLCCENLKNIKAGDNFVLPIKNRYQGYFTECPFGEELILETLRRQKI